MDIHESARHLGAISDEVSRELAENGLEYHCIHGSALLTRVLHQIGFPDAYPLTVGVRIFNSPYQQWAERHGSPEDEAAAKACGDYGGAAILLGKGTEGMVPEERWAGHLVVIVPGAFDDRHALLDLTIVQAHKPDWGIELQPLCLRVSDQFVSGRIPYKGRVNGSLLIYDAYPNDHSYNDDGDWMAITGLDEATSSVVRRLTSR